MIVTNQADNFDADIANFYNTHFLFGANDYYTMGLCRRIANDICKIKIKSNKRSFFIQANIKDVVVIASAHLLKYRTSVNIIFSKNTNKRWREIFI